MTFDLHNEIRSAQQTSPAWRLLRSQNAPMILSFLRALYKERHVPAVPQNHFLDRLREHLDDLRAAEPDQYPQTAEYYLNAWSEDDHFLRMFYEHGSDEPVVELTPEAERALRWVEELRPREFVGTESRFQRIFELLKQIVEESEADPEERIACLEEEKVALEKEIERIRLTRHVDTMSGTQVRERFLEASDLARVLLGDFREVEQNFKLLTRHVQQEQLLEGVAKGEIVGRVIDADDSLKESPQGQSFYAFWRFLLSPERQDELEKYVDEVFNLPEIASVGEDHGTLRRIKIALIEAGDKVVRSNHRLADQLRRLLDERNLAENRRVLDLITEIKQLALTQAGDPPEEADFMELDDRPYVEAPLERTLWAPAEETAFGEIELSEADVEVDLTGLFNPFAIDPAELEKRVRDLLRHRPQVTLAEVVEIHPIERGLSELVAYFNLTGANAQIEDGRRERILVRSAGSATARYVSLPQLIFTP